MNVVYETVQALLASLTPSRKESILIITNNLLKLKLSPATMDAIVAAVVLEAAEAQYVEQGGARSPPRESTTDLLGPILSQENSNKKRDVN
jgi:hypothetical protein